ncbi:SrfA family protein [Orbaceae bacterium ESL0721]|nr:SrfA family protein [Orbaceae bacterium ESL0721]
MVNTLLRSGDIKDFQLLGQDGKAVILVASQIRETLRVKIGREYADFLAIPERNDQGNNIDWYIPFQSDAPDGQYDIIPWSSASEEEREAAYQSLIQFEERVIALGKQLANRQNLEGDQLLFSRLIYDPTTNSDAQNLAVIRFPSEEYLYIVNGKPVITFWGFIHPQSRPSGSPFACLKPKPVIQPAVIPTITPAAVVVTKPWWKRAWFWLLALLLLLLALFLLRGCFFKPSHDVSLPNLTTNGGGDVAINSDKPDEKHIIKQVTTPIGVIKGSTLNGTGQINTSAPIDPNIDPNLDPNSAIAPITPDTPQPTDEINLPDLADNSDNLDNKDSSADKSDDKNSSDNRQENTANKNGANNQLIDPNAATTADNKLALPADAMTQGSTKFLNGSWTVGGGIQDKTTGKPLRLQYDFNQGNGEVTLTRSDGVKCVGNIGSNIAQSQLNITSNAEAQCSDNSKYQLPKIQCAAGKNSSADCQGFYDSGSKFPITIKKN